MPAPNGSHIIRGGRHQRVEAMSEGGKRAIEDAADRLGEMLLETAEGRAEYSYEDLVGAALAVALRVVCDKGPDNRRVEAVAAAIYAALHPEQDSDWTGLSVHEKGFWLDIARSAIAASDGALLDDIKPSDRDAADDT